MIQQWNPGAHVLKTFALQASYVIGDPEVAGSREQPDKHQHSLTIAADKEQKANRAYKAQATR